MTADTCLYYHDNRIHVDRAGHPDDPQHQVDYLGTLHQALLNVATECEKGIGPLPSTNYSFVDGEILVPASAKDRRGLQPVVGAGLSVKGQIPGRRVTVKPGETVLFIAKIDVPDGAGTLTRAAWDYDMKGETTGAAATPRSSSVASVTCRFRRKVRLFSHSGNFCVTCRVNLIRTEKRRKGYSGK